MGRGAQFVLQESSANGVEREGVGSCGRSLSLEREAKQERGGLRFFDDALTITLHSSIVFCMASLVSGLGPNRRPLDYLFGPRLGRLQMNSPIDSESY